MFTRVQDLLPKILIDELLRVARLDRNWVQWKKLEGEKYTSETTQPTWLRKLWQSGADAFSMWAASIWLIDGPKLFRPTVEQCKALEQIEVRLELHEYSQPYEALFVDLPPGYEPFVGVLCHKTEHTLTCVSHSKGNLNDITTTMAVDRRPLEISLQRYDDDCLDLGAIASRALRVAINACLALSNYGSYADYLYPKEVSSDTRLAKEDSERGKRARKRLELAPQLVRFEREVVLHRTENHTGEATGGEVGPHWRRGHWAMQIHGPNNTLRKRILRPPVLVRADKFLGNLSDTTTIYK